MTHISKQCRRVGRFRASLLASLLVLPFGACNTDELTDTAATDPSNAAEPTTAVETPSFSTTFRGGIPIGTFAQPISAFGDRSNGSHLNSTPGLLVAELAAIKARGGKVVLMFAGNERHYKDRRGHFDLGRWKARIDRYRNTNFSSYISDGTVLAHYMIDEPNDPANWNGRPVPASMLEEMARYSKQRWPTMPTIVRAEPGYLGTNHHYLDAAWAQYLHRKGPAADYLRRNVADAERRGLGLIVGMNVIHGGPNRSRMTASQLREWGSVLLNGSYPCAFISWTYDHHYISRSDVGAAMSHLAGRARSKTPRACRGGDGGGGGGGRPIALNVTGRERNGREITTLNWSGARGATVDVYRNGNRIVNTPNDGRYVNIRSSQGRGTYAYKVCQRRPASCSRTVRVTFN